MKLIHKGTLATAVIMLLALQSTMADEWRALSPKAKDNLPKYSTQPDTTPSTVEPQIARVGSPKMAANKPKFAEANASKNDPDLIQKQRRVIYTGRSPFQDFRTPMESVK